MSKIARLLTAALVPIAGMAASAGALAADVDSTSAAAFTAENDAAMAKMMADMHVPPTGNVDRDFIVMMIPHHQGAVDMARAQIRHGSNDRLKALCREIIAKQEEEIALMRQLLAAMPPAPEKDAHPAGQGHHGHDHMDM